MEDLGGNGDHGRPTRPGPNANSSAITVAGAQQRLEVLIAARLVSEGLLNHISIFV
jgi:hypothetical protein